MIALGGNDNRVLIKVTPDGEEKPEIPVSPDGYNLESSRHSLPVAVMYESELLGIEKPSYGLFFTGHGSPEIIPEALSLFWFSPSSWDIDLTVSRGAISSRLTETILRNEQKTLPDEGPLDFSEPLSTFNEAYKVAPNEDYIGGPLEEYPYLVDWKSIVYYEDVIDEESETFESVEITVLLNDRLFGSAGLDLTYWPETDEWHLGQFGISGLVTYTESEITSSIGISTTEFEPGVSAELEIRTGAKLRYWRGDASVDISGTMIESGALTLG
jgi:hypothetical protein